MTPDGPNARRGPLRVLLVEDDPDDYLLTQEALAEIAALPHELVWAKTFDEGLAAIVSGGFDVALVDQHLGAKTGLELLASSRVQMSATPVIMITGQGGSIDVEAAAAGAADYLPKDELDPVHLGRSIRFAVESRRRRRAERRFAALIENAEVIVALVQGDGRMRYASPALRKLVSVTDDDTFLDLVHPGDRASVAQELAEVASDEVPRVRFTCRVRHEGGYRWLDAIAEDFQDDPALAGIVVNARDVTERIQTEQVLREGEAALTERVKELRCLYAVSKALLETESWRATLGAVVEAVPPGFQFPDRTAARLTLEDDEIVVGRFDAVGPTLSSPIAVDDHVVGELAVGYLDGIEDEADPFLPEERDLIEAIADRIGETVRRRRADARLARSEAFFRTMAEEAGVIIAVIDGEGCIRYTTAGAEPVMDAAPEQALGMSVFSFAASPEDTERARHALGRAIDAPGTVVTDQVRVRGFDGTPRHVEFTARSLLDDETIGGVVVTVRDITERVQGEERLRFQAALLDEVGQAVFALDDDHRATYWNRAAEQIFGHPREAVMGEPVFGKIIPPDQVELAMSIRQAVSAGATWEGEMNLRNRRGDPVVLQGNVVPLEGGGRICAGVDITELRRTQQRLLEQRELIANVVASAPVVLFAFDRDGRFTLSMGRGLEQVGLSDGELVGQSIFEVYAGVPAVADHARRALAGEHSRSLVEVGGRVLETWWAPAKHGDGVIGVSVDVTNLERAEAEQRRLLAVIESSPDFIGLATAEETMTYVNGAGRRLVGLGPDEDVTGRSIYMFYSDPTRRQLREVAIPTAIREGSWRGEGALFGADGREIPIWYVVVAHRDPAGQLAFLSTVASDRTKQHQAAQQLRFQAQVLDTVGQAVIVTDQQTRIMYWNRAAERIYGWSAEEIMGRPITEVTPVGATRAQAEQILDRLRRGESWTGEFTVGDKAGREFVALVTNAPVLDEHGEQVGIVGVSSDLTDQKQLEAELRQAQKLEAIGRLAGGVAHDFNNLLTIIQGHVELLRDELAGADSARSDLHEIAGAARRATALTRQLLAFSRQQVLQPRVIDLAEQLRAFEGMIRRLVPESIELTLRLPDHPCRVRADPTQIDQVVLNLVVNAQDAMEGSGQLVIELARQPPPRPGSSLPTRIATSGPPPAGPQIMLRVHDSGPGIPEAILDHVFEPFFTTKESSKGTGLGLSTVYGIVKQSHGHIEVDSQPGEGAAFRIFLPEVDAPPEAQEASAGDPEAPPEGEETVLVVEDDPSVRRVSRRFLTRAGYHVLEAADGREALALVESHEGTIHVVLSDVVMPGMSGPELVQQLRKRVPDIAVVMTSGYTADHLDGGDAVFLSKPFSLDGLTDAIQRALVRRSTRPAPKR